MKTGKIRYNVQNRGREHRGKDRRFDLRAMAALVNSPEIQERVRNRDMVGYYGHWQRMKFGLIPPETVIVDGKVINIEPAIVTTHLHADDDGNIEHETEFLDNPSGKIAARLHGSKTGGFSSAVHAKPRGNFDVPTIFAGFDYVLEPNYTTNRGYVFDGIMDGEITPDGELMLLDSVMHSAQALSAMNVLYDSLQNDHALAMQTIQRLMEENEELLALQARGGHVFDSASGADFRSPLLVSKASTHAFAERAASFKHASLAAFERQKDDDKAGSVDAGMEAINRHYGVGK